MSKSDQQIEGFLFSEGTVKEKHEEYLKCLNSSTKSTLEENELENLISLHYKPIDISSKCIQTISNIEDSTEAQKFSNKVIKDIKERQKRPLVLPTLLAIAALITIGFYISLTPKQQSSNKNFAQNEPPSGTQIKGKNSINYKEGLSVSSSANSLYTFINSPEEFLSHENGELQIKVKNRKTKAPLYFSMPQGKIKVLGTEFQLKTNGKYSQASVLNGSIEFSHGKSSFILNPGESSFSHGDFIRKKFLFSMNEWDYNFEDESLSPEVDGKMLIEPGIIGNALKFDRLQKVKIQRKAISKNETFSLWVKVTESSPIGQSIAGQHDPKYSINGFHLYEEKGKLHLQLKNDTEELDRILDIDLSEWVHLVFIKNEWHINKLFVNGKMLIKRYLKYDYESNSKFYLGKSEDKFWSPLHGLVDELRIYQRELTVDDIEKLYLEKDLIKNVTK